MSDLCCISCKACCKNSLGIVDETEERSANTATNVVTALSLYPPIYKSILASSLGSFIATLVLNPISVIKIHLQNPSLINTNSIASTIRDIYNTNGFTSFWAGSRIGILLALPNTAIYMVTYEYLKYIFTDYGPLSIKGYSPGIAGGLARAISVTAIAPLELIRTVQAVNNKNTIDIINEIYSKNGFKGFYRGYSSLILRDAPFSSIYWLGFETFRSYFTSFSSSKSGSGVNDTRVHTNIINLSSGAAAGTIAAVVTHPFDVLKTFRQLQSIEHHSSPTTARMEMSDVIKSRSMYRGLGMRLCTVIPASAIMVTIYEMIKTLDF